MRRSPIPTLTLALLLQTTFLAHSADALDPKLQARIDAEIKTIQTWAQDPAIVSAVKAHNTRPAPELAAMTQDKWHRLPILDPVVRGFSKNPAAEALKRTKTDATAEAFLSGADGVKVAFLSKPTNWSHQGKPKHDVPMTGKVWQGPVELDESTGLRQIQVAVPVLDGTKPIGSLVVGLKLSVLSKQ
jgi:hypothetical protein